MSTLPHDLLETVSVVIPAYNRAGTIERAVRSALQQTVPPLEVLVIDDASRDETPQVVAAIPDKRVRLISLQVNRGAQHARCTGISSARGTIIVFLDSDDELLPDSVEKRLQALRESRLVNALVYGDAFRNGKLDRFEYCKGNVYPRLLEELSLCPFSVMLVPKRCFEISGFPDQDFPSWQDDDMVLTIGRHFPVVHCGVPVAVMHVDSGRISGNKYGVAEGCRRMVAKYASDIQAVHGGFRLFCWRLRIRRSNVIAAWSEVKQRTGVGLTVTDLVRLLFLAAERVVLKIMLAPFFRNFYG